MSTAFGHMGGDHLLLDSCDWYAFTGVTQNSTTLERTDGYATAVSLRCNVAPQVSRRWLSRWPDADLTRLVEFFIPARSAVTSKDKLVYGGANYRVKDVADWAGACRSVLAECIEGVT